MMVCLDVEMGLDEFIMMVEMGFFVRTGQRYQMVIPAGVTMGKVKRSALKFAKRRRGILLDPE